MLSYRESETPETTPSPPAREKVFRSFLLWSLLFYAQIKPGSHYIILANKLIRSLLSRRINSRGQTLCGQQEINVPDHVTSFSRRALRHCRLLFSLLTLRELLT